MWKRFWSDEEGAVLSAELILLMTILVIGLVAGLTAVRNAVVTEMADVGAAVGSLNQGFTFNGLADNSSMNSTAGSSFIDKKDLGDGQTSATGELGVHVVAPTPEL